MLCERPIFMKKYTLGALCSLLTIGSLLSCEQQTPSRIARGASSSGISFARVAGSPYPEANGKITKIIGTFEEMFGITHFDPCAFTIDAYPAYYTHAGWRTGAAYYGVINDRHYIFDPSWLTPKRKTYRPPESRLLSRIDPEKIVLGMCLIPHLKTFLHNFDILQQVKL